MEHLFDQKRHWGSLVDQTKLAIGVLMVGWAAKNAACRAKVSNKIQEYKRSVKGNWRRYEDSFVALP